MLSKLFRFILYTNAVTLISSTHDAAVNKTVLTSTQKNSIVVPNIANAYPNIIRILSDRNNVAVPNKKPVPK